MIELGLLLTSIDAIQIKLQQGGNLENEVSQIQSLLEKRNLIFDVKYDLQLKELINKISFLKEISKEGYDDEIFKIFRTITYLPELVKVLEKFVLEINSFNFVDDSEFTELTKEELKKLENLPREKLARFFNENEIQFSSCEKLGEALARSGEFVIQLDLAAILSLEGEEIFNNSALDEILSFCPTLNKLVIDATSLGKDPLEIIANHCTQLIELKLTGCQFLTVNGLYSLFSSCPSLQKVELSDCTFLYADRQNIEKFNSSFQLLIMRNCKGLLPDELKF